MAASEQIVVEEAKEPTVKTIDRAARVLRALASGEQEGLPLREVATACDIGKATAHRLLSALIDAGFAFQDTETRRYRLGAGLSLLAQAANQQHLGVLAQPVIRRIADVTSDTVYASIREGVAAVCVGREVGSFPIRTLTLEVGDRRPLGVGSGALALLAFLPDAEIESVLVRNESWIAEFPGYSIAYLREAAAEARRYGFSFVDGRLIPGMNAVGVPVRDGSGNVVAALSVAAIADRVSRDRMSELTGILHREAANLSKSIGAAG
jgi:DNA-binding IclR family transcriptional regulator